MINTVGTIGRHALLSNATGYNNVVIGCKCLYSYQFNYPVIVLEIVPEIMNIDGTDPIQPENPPKKRTNINGNT